MCDRLKGLPGCLFVTVPDVVAIATATAQVFEMWAPALERRDLPVAQDGLEHLTNWLERTWCRLDALFSRRLHRMERRTARRRVGSRSQGPRQVGALGSREHSAAHGGLAADVEVGAGLFSARRFSEARVLKCVDRVSSPLNRAHQEPLNRVQSAAAHDHKARVLGRVDDRRTRVPLRFHRLGVNPSFGQVRLGFRRDRLDGERPPTDRDAHPR